MVYVATGDPCDADRVRWQDNVRRLSRIGYAAILGGFLYGFFLAVIAGAEAALTQEFGLTTRQLGWVVSNLDLGAAVGAALAGPLSDRWGRKRLMMATAVTFLLSALLTAAAPHVTVLLLGRALAGLAVGALLIMPLYVAEISPARWRGFLVSLVQIGIVTGILLAYCTGWLGQVSDPANWRWMFCLGGVFAIYLLLVTWGLPESPRWLASRGESLRAQDVLVQVVGADAAQAALQEIHEGLRAESGTWRELLEPGIRKALVVGLLLTIFSVTVGINAVILYGPAILMRQAGQQASAALWGAVVLGGVNFAFSLIALVTIDRLGRKLLLLCGLVGMCLSMVMLGSRFAWASAGEFQGLLAPILVFVACYAVSLGPVTWVLLSEIFPTRIRGVAMALCLIVMYLADFVVTLTFPWMLEELGRATFLVFAAMCGLGIVFVLVCVPETKGKSLEQIEADWLVES